MEHITFDELAEFVSHSGNAAEFLKLAARINAHICSCPECYSVYDALVSLQDSVEDLQCENSLREKIQLGLLKSVHEKAVSDPIWKRVARHTVDNISRIKVSVGLYMKSLSEISVSDFDARHCFYHPVRAGAVKSYGDKKSSLDRNELKSVLVDEQMNRIAVDEDGTLAVRITKKQGGDNPAFFLVNAEDPSSIFPAEGVDGSDGMIRAVYYDVKPGKYYLIVI